jgi:hypothetical protein
LTLGFRDSATLAAKELGIKVPPSTNKLNEDSIKFQLQCMGHLLKRKNSDGFDNRVGFKPDAWQKELIDIVDQNGSALVVAPTSAGKLKFITRSLIKQIPILIYLGVQKRTNFFRMRLIFNIFEELISNTIFRQDLHFLLQHETCS